jgi:hypothetical protein
MSNHVIHVKSCFSYQIMLFMSNYVIHVKSCYSCQIISFMSNHVIHVAIHVIHVAIHVIHVAIHVIHVDTHVIYSKIHVHWSSKVTKNAFSRLCYRPKANNLILIHYYCSENESACKGAWEGVSYTVI